MKLKSDKGRTALALLITKVWEDNELKKKFKKNPAKVLKAEGIEIPEGVDIKVLQNTKNIRYLPLSQAFDVKKDQAKIQALFSLITPIPEGKEVRLVQSSKKTIYILIPVRPPKNVRKALSGVKLVNLAVAEGFEVTYHDTTQTLEAETTEAVVAETTEAMHVETSAGVVAEVALVLI